MSRLTLIAFHKIVRAQLSGEAGVCCKFIQVFACQKLLKVECCLIQLLFKFKLFCPEWYFIVHICSLSCHLFLSLHFNGHFPGKPGLAGVYWSKGWWKWWWQLDYWSYKLCKAPVKSSPPTNQHPVFFTGRMPFLSPNQQCQSTEGKISHSMDLLTPSSPIMSFVWCHKIDNCLVHHST